MNWPRLTNRLRKVQIFHLTVYQKVGSLNWHLGEVDMSMSVYTIHQAKFRNGRLSEVVILCRDEPEPPMLFYEETVMTVE